MLDEVFALFHKAAPACVLIRGVLENIFSVRRLNTIFEDTAQTQYTRELAFSSVVRLMSQVVMRIQHSVHAAYKQQAAQLGVSAKCVYNKLDGIEPGVTQELVRRTAREMELVIRTMGGVLPSLVEGLRTRILDGNHLAATDRRLKALQGQGGAALPGQALAVLDPELRLVVDLFPCEDAHTQERALLGQVLETVQPGDLWIADRNFCTASFLFGIQQRKAFFLVRHHAQSPHWEPLGEPVEVGEIASGRVFEQQVRLRDAQGQELVVRRITVQLKQPTRDGEMVIHLLTNLRPEQADALRVGVLYCERWQVETAFQELTVDLACEVSTLGYPKAALFAFAVAVSCYNAFSVTKAALRAGAALVCIASRLIRALVDVSEHATETTTNPYDAATSMCERLGLRPHNLNTNRNAFLLCFLPGFELIGAETGGTRTTSGSWRAIGRIADLANHVASCSQGSLS